MILMPLDDKIGVFFSSSNSSKSPRKKNHHKCLHNESSQSIASSFFFPSFFLPFPCLVLRLVDYITLLDVYTGVKAGTHEILDCTSTKRHWQIALRWPIAEGSHFLHGHTEYQALQHKEGDWLSQVGRGQSRVGRFLSFRQCATRHAIRSRRHNVYKGGGNESNLCTPRHGVLIS